MTGDQLFILLMNLIGVVSVVAGYSIVMFWRGRR